MSGHWADQALCAQTNPELWFPRPDGTGYASSTRAKSICAECPVTNPCLLHALENGIDYGIWGGLSADECNRLRRAPAPGWEASA